MAHRYRSAITGEFVTARHARRNPDTTVAEQVRTINAVFAHAQAVLLQRAQRKLNQKR